MVVGDAIVLIAFLGVLAWLASRGIAMMANRSAAGKATPGAGVLPGDSRAEIRTKEGNYRLLMRAVHVLDNQLTDADIRPFLPEEMQTEMKSIVHDFFNY